MDCTSAPRKSKQKAESLSERGEVNPFLMKPQIPPDETEAERSIRIREMQDAQKISRKIDDYILEHKKALDRRKKAAKILLLGAFAFRISEAMLSFWPAGQSESGKVNNAVMSPCCNLTLIHT